ncbi:MAG: hypothetical protein Q4F45_02870 [Alistipes sp.]|nr:hypothetical protein [Alistipes sp.]
MNKSTIKTCTLKDVVYVGPAATNLAGKPCRGSLLATKFIPNKMSDMNHKAIPIGCLE